MSDAAMRCRLLNADMTVDLTRLQCVPNEHKHEKKVSSVAVHRPPVKAYEVTAGSSTDSALGD